LTLILKFGIITHEIGHALGFFHEQSRWDRDNHVSLNVESILPGFEDQFIKASFKSTLLFLLNLKNIQEMPEDNDNEQVDYDYGSVMHYTECKLFL
jgi:astacin